MKMLRKSFNFSKLFKTQYLTCISVLSKNEPGLGKNRLYSKGFLQVVYVGYLFGGVGAVATEQERLPQCEQYAHCKTLLESSQKDFSLRKRSEYAYKETAVAKSDGKVVRSDS
jgi:hypothetical protein